MQEEELKNRIGKEYFGRFDYNRIIGKIDFCVSDQVTGIHQNLLWAEAKKGAVQDVNTSFVQLILTIGRGKTYSYEIPPKFLGAFDEEKIAFIEYSEIQHVFSQNDFNWNVPPSDHTSKEFLQLYDMVEKCLNEKSLHFRFSSDYELRKFIDKNFAIGVNNVNKIHIDKNNFVHVFNRWLDVVKPTILVKDWEAFNKKMILSADFFLADLMSDGEKTIIEKLRVLLNNNIYKLKVNSGTDELGLVTYSDVHFKDKQKAHTAFWNIYERPPKEIYQQYILERRDLLVPQDIRERKGAYFTPQKWVNLSHQYIAKALGDDWQDEYYIWDCCAGTGNLLVGLTNKYKIFASTLDQADVDIMKERAANGANLLEGNIFQFDFLNDSFDDKKVPAKLKEIINDPEKRKKLVVYINPPYAESGNKKQVAGNGENKAGTAVGTKILEKYKDKMGAASNELFAQFFIRIFSELRNAKLAEFSTLKILQSPNFKQFRKVFRAELKKMFVVPANTFDNVKGQFPIGFLVWDTSVEKNLCSFFADVYSSDGIYIKPKLISIYDDDSLMMVWKRMYYKSSDNKEIGFSTFTCSDFQHQNYTYISNGDKSTGHQESVYTDNINMVFCVINYAVRMCIQADWLNDRDQFLYPNDGWKTDKEFQNDCLAFTLFHGQNRISIEKGENHWIPFTENEVSPRDSFSSHFMTDYIRGKVARYDDYEDEISTMTDVKPSNVPLVFSQEAQDVFSAGRELWTYYHKQDDSNPDASFYDIRKYFQGVNDKGKMNADSEDEEYTRLIGILKEKMKVLAKKIEPKVYEYGFLR